MLISRSAGVRVLKVNTPKSTSPHNYAQNYKIKAQETTRKEYAMLPFNLISGFSAIILQAGTFHTTEGKQLINENIVPNQSVLWK